MSRFQRVSHRWTTRVVASFVCFAPALHAYGETRALGSAAFASAMPASAAHAQETPGASLSADDAVRIAVTRSQRVAANSALVEAARERAVAAGKHPDPVFTTGLQAVPLNTNDRFKLHNDSFTMTAFGVKQELTSRDKLDARVARYAREADSGEAARTLSIVEIARDTRLAWLARSYLESSATLLDDAAREVADHLEATDAAYRGGRGTQSETIAIRTELERIDDRRRENARDLAVAQARLERWIGDAAEHPLTLRAALVERPVPDERRTALLTTVDAHPALRRLTAQEAAARAEANMARTERSADWSVELALGLRRPTYSNLGTINFSIPITWNRADRQDREVAARQSEADAAAAEREEARRIAVADLRAAMDVWRADRDRLRRYDTAFIPLALQRNDAALAAWRGGAGTLAIVLDAHHAETEMRLDRLKLERSLAETSVQLDYWLSASARDASTGLSKDQQ